jgi:hypothetical protein
MPHAQVCEVSDISRQDDQVMRLGGRSYQHIGKARVSSGCDRGIFELASDDRDRRIDRHNSLVELDKQALKPMIEAIRPCLSA